MTRIALTSRHSSDGGADSILAICETVICSALMFFAATKLLWLLLWLPVLALISLSAMVRFHPTSHVLRHSILQRLAPSIAAAFACVYVPTLVAMQLSQFSAQDYFLRYLYVIEGISGPEFLRAGLVLASIVGA